MAGNGAKASSDPAAGYHASRYQSLRFQKVLSQPLNVALSFLEIADACGRHTTGMTTPASTTISFMAMNSAARLAICDGDGDHPRTTIALLVEPNRCQVLVDI